MRPWGAGPGCLPLLVLLLQLLLDRCHTQELRICMVVPIKGDAVFRHLVGGCLLAAEHINQRNGSLLAAAAEIPDGLRLNLDIHESEGGVSPAMAATVECLFGSEGPADAVVGALRSAVTVPLAYLTGVEDVPHVAYASTSGTLTDRENFPTFFRTSPRDETLARALVSIGQALGWLSVGVLAPMDTYGQSFFAALQDAGREMGVVLVPYWFTYLDESTYEAAVGDLAESGSRVVVAALYADIVTAMVVLAGAKGLLEEGRAFVLADETLTDAAVEEIGDLAQGLVAVAGRYVQPALRSAADAVWAESAAQWSAWQARHPALAGAPNPMEEPMLDLTSLAYDAMWAMALGLVRAGPGGGGRAVVNALAAEGGGFAGLSGDIKFTPDGDRNVSGLVFDITNVQSAAGGAPGLSALSTAAFSFDAGLTLTSPVEWPGGTSVTPADGSTCQGGTEAVADTAECGYRLGLLMPWADGGSVHTRAAAAAFLAVHHINTRDPSLVPEALARLPPDFRLVPRLFDTQASTSGGILAVSRALDLGVTALIGAGLSEVSVPVATISQGRGVPQVSYGAAARRLSSGEEFPFFSRTIPSEENTATSVGKGLVFMGWTRVAVMYPSDAYGVDFFTALQDFTSGLSGRIDFIGAQYEAGSASSIDAAAGAVLRSRAYVVVVVAYPPDVSEIMESADGVGLVGPGRVWVFGDVDLAAAVSDEERQRGAAAAAGLSRRIHGAMRFAPNPAAASRFAGLGPALERQGPEALGPALTAQLLEADPRVFSAATSGLELAAYAFDAVVAAALAIAEVESGRAPAAVGTPAAAAVRSDVSRSGAAIRDALVSGREFAGVSGDLVRFEPGGDRRPEDVPTLFQNYMDHTRAMVDAGLVIATTGMVRLSEPIVFYDNTTDVPEDGATCNRGESFDGAELACQPCQLGLFANSRGQTECFPCDAGSYSDQLSSTICTGCAVGAYQSDLGQQSCLACPSGTTTAVQKSVRLDACVCSPGYYRRDGMSGRECYICPDGAVCDGGSSAPYPRLGWWGDWEGDVLPMGVEDSSEAARDVHKTAFHACSQGDCDGTCGAPKPGPSSSRGDLEALRLCRSDSSRQCKDGREGRMCSRCALGWFSLGGQCSRCRSPSGLFVAGCLSAIVGGWVMINSYVSARYDGFDMMLLFLQIASMISTFDLKWPELLEQNVFTLLRFIDFDVDFFTPECLSTDSYSAWTYSHALLLQFALPLIMLGFKLLQAAANVAWREAMARARGGPAPTAEHLLAAARESLPEVVASVTSVLSTMYHTITIRALSAFSCTPLPGGVSFLTAAPEHECWTGTHARLVPVAAVALLVYTIGVPVCFTLVLRWGARTDKFRDPWYSACFGWMYLRLEKEWWWWELVFLLRRGTFCLVAARLQKSPALQVAAGVAIIGASIAAHFFSRPFLVTRIDYVETFGLGALLCMVCLGLLFYDESLEDVFAKPRDVLLVLSLVVFAVSFLVTLVIALFDVAELEMSKYLGRTLEKRLRSSSFAAAMPAGGAGAKEGKKSMVPESSRRLVNRGPSMRSLGPPLLGEHGSGGVRVELLHTLDTISTFQWLRSLADPGGAAAEGTEGSGSTRAWAARPGRSLTVADSLRGHQGVAERIQKLSRWTSAILADDSPVSYYSRSNRARFRVALLRSVPGLIDFLLLCDAEVREQTAAVVAALEASELGRESEGVGALHDLVSPVDHAAMASWLMSAEEEQVEEARLLLEAIRDRPRPQEQVAKTFRSRRKVDAAPPDVPSGEAPVRVEEAGGEVAQV